MKKTKKKPPPPSHRPCHVSASASALQSQSQSRSAAVAAPPQADGYGRSAAATANMVNVNVNVNPNPSSSSQSLVNCAAAQPASPAGGGGGGANSSSNNNANNANNANAAIVGPGAGAGAGSGSGTGSFAASASASASASSPPPTSSSSVNTLALASTILKSCPMYDTIAILIFLLQLPPIVLTLVQFLFASLTFMPPAGISTSALTSNFDIFQGPAGTPSLSTMIAMDAFCLLVWGLFMWTWAQNFAIDLAQVQVAITLGGGSSEKNGGVNLLCVLVVLALHLLRSQGVQDFVLTRLLSAKVVSAEMLAKIAAVIPADLRSQVAADREPPQPPTWLRSLLAVHILAQAGTAMARRSMAKNRSPAPSRGKRGGGGGGGGSAAGGGGGNSSSNSKDAGASAGNLDTEAAAGSGSHLDSSAFESSSTSGIHSSYFTSSQDIVPTTSSTSHSNNATNTPPAIKETRERLSSAKKRRRQANQVRSRQPFWAALASTKVTVMREYEHSRTGAWSSSAFGSVSSASASSSADSGAAGAAAPGYSSSFVSSVPSALSLSSGSGSGSGYIHPMAEDDFEGGLVQDIWITSIESSAIKFAASDFPIVTSDCCAGGGGSNGDAVISPTASSSSPFSGTGTGTGTDRKDDDDAGLEQQQQQQQQQQLQQLQTDNINPFHVYVNGAPWATVSMVPVPQNAEEPSLVRWRGEISGLAPDCTYSCSFVRRDTGARICVMSVKTSRKSENEAFAPSTNNSPRPSLRPSSPLTTMKNSVRSTEEQLAQRRQYLRKVKGDQKATISRLRKEVENYANRLKSANDETKLRQRTTQLERTIKQTEEQIHTLSQRVKDSENIPELERAEWKRARSRFESEMERLADLRAELDSFRKSSNEKVSSVQSELTNTVQKRERLQARIVRLTEQLERITVANEKGMNERERRAAEQLAREQERANIEANFLEQITLLANSVHDYQGRTANLWAQANAIDQAFQAQQQQYYLLHNGVNPAAAASAAVSAASAAAAAAAAANGANALTEPLTPDGHLPGTNPDLAATIPTTTSTTTATTTAAAAAAHTALSAFSPFAQSALGSMSISPAISSSALDQFQQQQQQQHPLHQHQHQHQHHQHPQHSFHHATSAHTHTHTHHHQPHASLTPSFNSLSSSAAVQAAFSPANATAGDAHNTPSGGAPGGSGSNNGSSSTGSGGSGSNSASNGNSNSNSKRHRSLSNFSGRSIQLDRNGTPYVADAMSRPVIHETAAALQRESGSPIAGTGNSESSGSGSGSGTGTGTGSHRKWSVKE